MNAVNLVRDLQEVAQEADRCLSFHVSPEHVNRKELRAVIAKADAAYFYAVLVYQAGLANVFTVDCLNMAPFGRNAQRIYQGDFRGAQLLVRGLGLAGYVVRSAHCNLAGDIISARWREDMDNAVFSPADIRIN